MVDLSVRARASRRNYDFGETIDLNVSVKNVSADRLYLVTALPLRHQGVPYIWKSGQRRISVLLAEAELPAGFAYYAYIPPALISLAPGRERIIPIHIGMPPRQGRIERNIYSWAETPVSGKVTIELTVGYLRSRFRARTSAPWAEFLRQQEKAAPARVSVHVAPK
jgi:hypothetical protein